MKVWEQEEGDRKLVLHALVSWSLRNERTSALAC